MVAAEKDKSHQRAPFAALDYCLQSCSLFICLKKMINIAYCTDLLKKKKTSLHKSKHLPVLSSANESTDVLIRVDNGRNLRTLVKCITLRRTKSSKVNGRPLVSLPEKTVCVEQVQLSRSERQEYELARKEGRNTIQRFFFLIIFIFMQVMVYVKK